MKRILTLLLLATSCTQAHPETKPTLKVAAAADLALAFPEIGALYTAQTGVEVVFSFGSSGLLARQIEQGGPFDAYASANVQFVDDLVAGGHCDPASRAIYGIGRVGVWSKDARRTLDALESDEVVKIAIPNPEHAPYGLAAKQALERSGRWAKLQPKLVYGENARQSLQIAQSGNAEAAFVPLSLATSAGGQFVIIDDALHAPLQQGVAACGKNRARGQRFIDLVMSERGHAIMRKYGFLLPGDTISAEL